MLEGSDDFIIDPDSDDEGTDEGGVGTGPGDVESADDAKSSDSEFHTPEAMSPAERLATVPQGTHNFILLYFYEFYRISIQPIFFLPRKLTLQSGD